MNKLNSRYFKASLALAATGMTAGTSEGVVVNTIHDTTLNLGDGGDISFDINDDAIADYSLLFADNDARKPQITTTNFNAGGLNQIFLPDADQNVRTLPVLTPGTVVDSNLLGGVTLEEAFFYLNFEQNHFGDWGGAGGGPAAVAGDMAMPSAPPTGPVEGYIGLRMPTDETLTSFNYGYARIAMDVSASFDTLATASISVRDSAFETVPDTAITIAAPPARVTLEVDTATGETVIRNLMPEDANLDYYRINSNGGALREGDAFWSSLEDQGVDAGGAADGDFNNDNVVDAADYTLWRDSVGSPDGTLANDGGLTGVIGDDHLDLWKANYGAEGGSGGIGWVESGGSDASVLAESFIATEGSLLASGDSYSLGAAFTPGGAQDLTFHYAQDGVLKIGDVTYVSSGALSAAVSAPEPFGLTLLVGAGVSLAGVRRRRVG